MGICLLVGSPRWGGRRLWILGEGGLGSHRTSGIHCSMVLGRPHRDARSPSSLDRPARGVHCRFCPRRRRHAIICQPLRILSSVFLSILGSIFVYLPPPRTLSTLCCLPMSTPSLCLRSLGIAFASPPCSTAFRFRRVYITVRYNVHSFSSMWSCAFHDPLSSRDTVRSSK